MPDRKTSSPRILRIITRLNIGGPSLHAILLSLHLDPERFSTCLVVGKPDPIEGDLSQRLCGHSVKMVRLSSLRRPIHPFADLLSLLRIWHIVLRERPQVIHTHMAKAGTLGRLAGALYNWSGHWRSSGARAILIHTFHGHVLDGYFPRWLSWMLLCIEQRLAKSTDCLIAVNPVIRDQLLHKGIGRPDQWRVIPLGLDLSAFSQLPFSNGSSLIRCGLIGRLVPIKNPGLFLQALHRLLVRDARREDLCGVIVGDGPLRPILERETERLGLEQVVRFTGWQQDVASVYRELEIACLTSENEGTPVSLIEAMAAGRAIVGTDVGGVRDLLGGMEAPRSIPRGGCSIAPRGILIRPGDADGLAVALETLASDANLRAALGKAARAYALEAFSQHRLLRDVGALYERLRVEG